ncbi:MAG TPA: hypothetical protein VFY71_17795 [Planctomycetota bacterium]|nr:hypothetical protein [Planctomycetota bacterium]
MGPDNDRRLPDDSRWELGWEGHAAAQAEYMARLPFNERLRWLQEAHALALVLLGAEGFERARNARLGPGA